MYGLDGEVIWIDDIRPAPIGMRWCKNYDSAIATLDYFVTCEGGIDGVHFDHDLGQDSKSGYEVAKYIVENQIPIGYFSVHSMNPVGRSSIIKLLTYYGYKHKTF